MVYGYEIKLRNPEGKAKYCSGHMNYPENILDFIIVSEALGCSHFDVEQSIVRHILFFFALYFENLIYA